MVLYRFYFIFMEEIYLLFYFYGRDLFLFW